MDEATPTVWLNLLKQGDSLAVQKLWHIYYAKLVDLARSRLRGRSGMVADEEDMALSTFRTFCRGIQEDRYPELSDRDSLWKLLVTITLYKTQHLLRDESRQKRGGKWRRMPDQESVLSEFASSEPTPEMAAQVAEDCDRLLAQLPTSDLAELAVLKLEGFTNAEIAEKWGKAERTVERKLQLIRQIWEQEFEP